MGFVGRMAGITPGGDHHPLDAPIALGIGITALLTVVIVGTLDRRALERKDEQVLTALSNGTARIELITNTGTIPLSNPRPEQLRSLNSLINNTSRPSYHKHDGHAHVRYDHWGDVSRIRISDNHGHFMCEASVHTRRLGEMAHRIQAAPAAVGRAQTVQDIMAVCAISPEEAAKAVQISYNTSFPGQSLQQPGYAVNEPRMTFGPVQTSNEITLS